MEEFRKSVSAILYNRVASPLYGTFILSWLVWNWQPLYLTLFVSETKLQGDKLSFIVSNYNDIYNLLWWPLASTIGILTLGQLIANGAFWLDEVFTNWRVEKRNTIQKNKMISVQESIDLRTAIRNQNEEFQKLLKNKDDEIASYKTEVNGLNGRISMLQQEHQHPKGVPLPNLSLLGTDEDRLLNKLNRNDKLKSTFKEAWISVRDRGILSNETEVKEFILANNLAVRGSNSVDGQPRYQPTDLGNKFYQLYYNSL